MAAKKASGKGASELFSEDVVHGLSAFLSLSDLLSLLSTCQFLRGLDVGISLEHLPMTSERLLECVRRFGHLRRTITACDVSRCTERDFNAILRAGVRRLTVRASLNLESLDGFEHAAPGFRSLRLLQRVGEKITDLSPLRRVSAAIESLSLHNARRLASVAALAPCAKLRSLDLRRCEALCDLSGLADERSAVAWALESLNLQGCAALKDVGPFGALRRLRSLDLSLCAELVDVAPLGRCAELRTLVLTGCQSVREVGGLVGCKELTTLFLSRCTGIDDVDVLVGCTALEVLHLNRCPQLIDVGELGHCPSLRLLNLASSGVQRLPCRQGLRVKLE